MHEDIRPRRLEINYPSLAECIEGRPQSSMLLEVQHLRPRKKHTLRTHQFTLPEDGGPPETLVRPYEDLVCVWIQRSIPFGVLLQMRAFRIHWGIWRI